MSKWRTDMVNGSLLGLIVIGRVHSVVKNISTMMPNGQQATDFIQSLV